MKKPNIVFVGHVCIDHNTVEHAKYVDWGSPALYMTKYFQHAFGIHPTIVASYGADFGPYAKGVSLFPETPPTSHTMVYENIIRDGLRTQYCYRNGCTPPPLSAQMKSIVSKADILLLAPLAPDFDAVYVTKLLANTRPSCLKVLSPQGYLRHIASDGLVSPQEFEAADKIVPLFDLVILSDEDHPDAIAKTREWKRAGPHTEIVVTQNADGASIIGLDGDVRIPTKPILPKDVVDSVGSGDVFSAAAAYHLHQTKDLSQSIRQGHAAAREKLLSPSHL